MCRIKGQWGAEDWTNLVRQWRTSRFIETRRATPIVSRLSEIVPEYIFLQQSTTGHDESLAELMFER